MDWFRWHAGSVTDPKFRVVARKAAAGVPGVRLSDVLAVWAMLLERASEGEDRGRIEGFDCEAADAHLELPPGAAQAISRAMCERGLLARGRVASWERRQPRREDWSTDRVRQYRERQRLASKASEARTGSETLPDAPKRIVTPGNARRDEKRGEKKITPPPPDSGCNHRAGAQGENPGGEEGGRGGQQANQAAQEGAGGTVATAPGGPAWAEQGSLGGQQVRPAAQAGEGWAVAPEIRQIGETYPQARFDPGAADRALKELDAREQWPGLGHIQADLGARLASEDWTREGGRFVPKLSRYLRERMWLMSLPGARGQPQPAFERQPGGEGAERTENPSWRDDTVATDRAREVLEALKTGKRPEFLN
jgi:hypothetical protein